MATPPPALHTLIAHQKWLEAATALSTPDGKIAATLPYSPHATSNNNEFPLLIACDLSAPAPLILSILRLCPSAASQRSKRNGCYPLHHACNRRLDPKVIFELIKAYPDALDMKNDAQFTPRDCPTFDSATKHMVQRRATLCWKKLLNANAVATQKLERLSSLREKRWKLKALLDHIQPRIHTLQERLTQSQLDKCELLKTYSGTLLTLRHRMEEMERHFYVRILLLKPELRGDKPFECTTRNELPLSEKRAECAVQTKYVEDSVESMIELETRMTNSKTQLEETRTLLKLQHA